MAALDTNVLVRFLVQDDAAQGNAASRLIEDAGRTDSPLFVSTTVLLELVWVLRSAFGFDKSAVSRTLHGLLGATELEIESEAALEFALMLYEGSAADFADCLHVALAADRAKSPMWTFDKAASRLDGARLLTPAWPGIR